MSDTQFPGFPTDTTAFLADLAENNSRDWFQDNKARYQAAVVDPAMEFIAAMAGPLADLEPGYTAEARLNGSFRRLNRDVRFSKDKSPYSARLHMVFWTGNHPMRSPALHFVIHPDSWGYGAGQWQWPPETLDAYRAALGQPDQLKALKAAIAKAGSVGCILGPPDLKRPPRGTDPDHPAGSLVQYKSMVCRTHDAPDLPDFLHKPDCVTGCLHICQALSALNQWLVRTLPAG